MTVQQLIDRLNKRLASGVLRPDDDVIIHENGMNQEVRKLRLMSDGLLLETH